MLDAELSRAQTILISHVARRWWEEGEWPIWESVEDALADIGPTPDEAKKGLYALPRGAQRNAHSGYGFTGPLPSVGMLREEQPIELTVAAALVDSDVDAILGKPFLLTLKHMIEVYEAAPRQGNQPKKVNLTSEELAKAIPTLKAEFIRRLPEVFNREPILPGSFATLQGGDWTYVITRKVTRFAAVYDIRGYVATTLELLQGDDTPTPSAITAPPVPAALEAAPAPYIDADLITELEKVGAASNWDLKKLLAILRELNSNIADRHPFAAAALIRAVMDHIPPAFGQKGFAGMASSYKWSETDGKHAKALAGHRIVGDDVMHRQVSREKDLITMDDLPGRTGPNAILRELLVILRKDVQVKP
ncbi:hypothetical protein ACEZCY_02625 [Streptacidiphilus sp. N1-12]|uniref:Uncharacterized protein n=2 Tax=Streptacidiphilus alkalitolerans TaxID=3342712 RepID=A0ABV6W7Y8_9ACTN